MVLVDANVLIDILTDDPQWRAWSEAQLLSVAADELAINPIIYAELGAAYRTSAALERALRPLKLLRLPLPFEAGFFPSSPTGDGAEPSDHRCRISTSEPTLRPKTIDCSRATPLAIALISRPSG